MIRHKLLASLVAVMAVGAASYANAADSSMGQTSTAAEASAATPTGTSSSPSTAADAKVDAALTTDTAKTEEKGAMTHEADATAATSKMTKDFIKNSAIGGMFEIESSKVALTKSSNQDIKDFAQKMVDDHSKASDDMKSNLTTAQAEMLPAKLDMKHQKMLDKLNNDDATAFDMDYIKAQVSAHKEAVTLFDKYAEKGDDAKLKEFAVNTLPTLKEHKEKIDAMKSSMKSAMK